jgi:hypothetical protein
MQGGTDRNSVPREVYCLTREDGIRRVLAIAEAVLDARVTNKNGLELSFFHHGGAKPCAEAACEALTDSNPQWNNADLFQHGLTTAKVLEKFRAVVKEAERWSERSHDAAVPNGTGVSTDARLSDMYERVMSLKHEVDDNRESRKSQERQKQDYLASREKEAFKVLMQRRGEKKMDDTGSKRRRRPQLVRTRAYAMPCVCASDCSTCAG